MTEEVRELLEELDRVCEFESVADIDRYIVILDELAGTTDPKVLQRLFRALRDHEAGEVQYELVELCETFSDEVYVRVLLSELEGMLRRSPSWTGLLLQSVLNTPSARASLGRSLLGAPQPERQALLTGARAIAADDARYSSVVSWLEDIVPSSE